MKYVKYCFRADTSSDTLYSVILAVYANQIIKLDQKKEKYNKCCRCCCKREIKEKK